MKRFLVCLVLIFLLSGCQTQAPPEVSSVTSPAAAASAEPAATAFPSQTEVLLPPEEGFRDGRHIGGRNAQRLCYSFLDQQPYSCSGLTDKLVLEGYPLEEALYAVEHCGIDWTEQAVRAVQRYLEEGDRSRQELLERLLSEGFTSDEAEAALAQNGF